MQWLYFVTAVLAFVLALYHLFSHRHRVNNQETRIYSLKHSSHIDTDSTRYMWSVRAARVMPVTALFLILMLFQSFPAATVLFALTAALGLFVLLTLDKTFEVQDGGVVFAGYHARWNAVKSIYWGRKRPGKKQLVMELQKGQRITTFVSDKDAEDVQKIISAYTFFDTHRGPQS
ncbi:hypothetical protein [Alkalicoccus urumqiensis]|uniref:DUF5673 domain-containing protein n=1 Tax=Alkalicoccus urumqiensis TaxID=1548213 RepID=A0A2P6MF11_ALKUR|nr:hypothetical protein [Alkalicoccus urumqiensis]PRO64868.1 hypothetical protein C6I21_12020 [Alkalicoccus urumqiensis]